MGERGPKGKPIELAQRDGTKRSRVPSLPLRTGAMPTLDEPQYFNDFQLTAWHHLVEILTGLGILDIADQVAIETCAAMIGKMREARHNLSHEDMVYETSRGLLVPSPWWRIEREAALQVHRLLSELGLTPSARSRLANSGVSSKKPEETLADILGPSGRLKALDGGK